MKRWGIAFLIALFWGGVILMTRSTSSHLLQDSDTAVMLQRIEARGNPWSWFAGDWPLENHFYRPVVAETFELDLAIHGKRAQGYALTNALLCAFCVLALFWFLRELTNNVALTTGATSLFAIWHLFANPPPVWIGMLAYGLAGAGLLALILAMIRRRPVLPSLLAMSGSLLLGKELIGVEQFRGGMIEWIPGRTASTMALFALLALAAYARFERTGAERAEPEPGPLDPPATRGTQVSQIATAPWIWAVAAGIFTLLALASYEQAVMLPALLLGVAFAMRLQHFRVRWAWPATYWLLLVGYILFRGQVLPEGTSGYQAQQFRTGPGVILSITDYVFPAGREMMSIGTTSDLGISSVLVAQYAEIMMVLANALAMIGLFLFLRRTMPRRERALPVVVMFALTASFFAFLPMGWMKPFSAYNHYHYWPLALRSVYVAGLTWVVIEWLIAAWSPQALQAPRRPAPAPGSLPHR